MTDKEDLKSIDAYISKFKPETQEILKELRGVIHECAPEAIEKISYQMPTFALFGNLVHFAAYEHHIGFYPAPSAIEAFSKELSQYKNAKGSVQFPINAPLPYDLIKAMVKFRVAENIQMEQERNIKKKKG